MTKSSFSWLGQALVLATLIAGTFIVNSSSAWADDSYGTPSISYSGVTNPPTADKPQRKLWWNDGSWWADMWTSGSGWSIYRLDRGTGTWVDTGVGIDNRNNTLADRLWDGEHLYIASPRRGLRCFEVRQTGKAVPLQLHRWHLHTGQ